MFSFTSRFYVRPAARSAKRVLAIVILSVCRPSLCLSVTTRYRFKPI